MLLTRHQSSLVWIGVVVPLGAALLVLPMLIWGYPRTAHDFNFHVLSWMDVAHQWQHGVVFPRWAMLADYGYGEPRFIFYPPFSWLLGGALSFVLPWKIVPGVFVWLALTGAGAAMFFLAGKWLPRPRPGCSPDLHN